MQTIDRHFLPLRPGDRVLDLGCGEGRHVVAASVMDGVDAIGVDLSLDDLATARARRDEFEALWAAQRENAASGGRSPDGEVVSQLKSVNEMFNQKRKDAAE